MKINREQFLAAALLFASTTGCGKLSDRMKGEFNASQDPAVVDAPGAPPVNVNPSDPASGARLNSGTPVKAPVAKNAKTIAPAKEGVAPASETVSLAPSKEGFAPAKENVAPASENVSPSNESWRRGRRGPSAENIAPARENVGPSNESWRRRNGPASENIKPKTKA